MIGQLLTGRYLILKKLGSGGFSETYLARDKYLPRHPVCVVKCLNVSPSSAISPETAHRLFETEARILDQLGRQHPQIPTLYAYCHEQEQIYQVQEYIDGENLRGWVNQGRRLTAEAAIDLLQEVLPVLDYIHSHRVIHRDIKPSNLIRRRRDGKVVLLDFGAACFLADTATQTKPESEETPIVIGTPGYMPDEQHLGMSQMNSDLYALGILVIQLLTGVQPHQFQQDLISGELNWQSHLRQSPGSPTIHPGVIAILEQMVRSHPHNRYQSATEVLTALQALPIDRPVQRSASSWFVPNWQQWVQQAWKPVATTLVLTSLLGAGYVYSQGHEGVAALSRLALLTRPSTVDLTILHDWAIDFEVDRLLVAPKSQAVVAAGSDHVLHLWSLSDGSVRQSLTGHTDKINALSISQDGRFLISGSADRTIRLWDMASGQLLQTFDAHQAPVTAVALSPDAKTLASGDEAGTIRLWDLPTGTLLQTVVASDAITALSYGTTSQNLISASGDRLSVWDLRTGEVHRQFAGHTGTILGLQVVDQMLISMGDDRTLLWNLEREELMQVCSEDSAKTVTASLSNQHMITVNNNGSIRVWASQSGHLVEAGAGELGQNLDVAVSPDHRYVVSWKPDQRLQVWQMSAAVRSFP